jgi:alkylhydroperoxidase family enzyme
VARVPLLEETNHPELAESIAKIKGARGGRLINIYRLMLHSPALADAWFDLNQAVRYGTEIDGRSRELAVLRVAILNGVEYVQRAHGPAYALKEGLTPDQVSAIADWQASNLFSDPQRRRGSGGDRPRAGAARAGVGNAYCLHAAHTLAGRCGTTISGDLLFSG